jgi:dihydrofolate reductase
MALKFKVGDIVKENKFVITGAEVIGASIPEGSTDVFYKLRYTDVDGNQAENFFQESALDKE